MREERERERIVFCYFVCGRWCSIFHIATGMSSMAASRNMETLTRIMTKPCLTARELVLEPFPPFPGRNSERSSTTCTLPTRSKTFTELKPWADFSIELEQTLGLLDNTHKHYYALYLPAPMNSPADECEVRGPFG
ncbi:hypothetical protein O6H91_21G074700 [Diphasiastrum complanatum]|uniref:Uncharacterized protein n=2 Tax=Diphasiastrum complanatum TaxID=34168 RepID=A0ACC2ALJ7_DIPCM|nr:hypothetical protein O6H91_21G064800 [Diphasiastrum complanatum]KAJ7518564.1 hypothetical protein O6H91_21G074700 [Diphasiastrum complanatum]